jgi:hypothetical protein
MFDELTQYNTETDNANSIVSRPIKGAAIHVAQSVLLLERGRRQMQNRNRAARLERITTGLRSIGSALERLGQMENEVRP